MTKYHYTLTISYLLLSSIFIADVQCSLNNSAFSYANKILFKSYTAWKSNSQFPEAIVDIILDMGDTSPRIPLSEADRTFFINKFYYRKNNHNLNAGWRIKLHHIYDEGYILCRFPLGLKSIWTPSGFISFRSNKKNNPHFQGALSSEDGYAIIPNEEINGFSAYNTQTGNEEFRFKLPQRNRQIRQILLIEHEHSKSGSPGLYVDYDDKQAFDCTSLLLRSTLYSMRWNKIQVSYK